MTLMYEKKKNETDKLFTDLNSYHENIKLTLEINPKKFLDAKIIRNDQGIKTQVYNKAQKLPVHYWCSKVCELHRARRTAKDFDKQKELEVHKRRILEISY